MNNDDTNKATSREKLFKFLMCLEHPWRVPYKSVQQTYVPWHVGQTITLLPCAVMFACRTSSFSSWAASWHSNQLHGKSHCWEKNMVASLIYKAKRCANWATANSQENFVLLSVLFALALFQILTKPDPRRQPCSSNSSATSKSEFSITCSLTCLLAIE